ncbi:hypothetical protein [Halopiger djelfimassiliensis]|uniref:hypothetical protein n=1 Tax=Halopiger djelfimassiliensis TaxID=1293047 RepID=UPI000677A043|nr:hypothetical protein [Halopiger djelfimassiliensis]
MTELVFIDETGTYGVITHQLTIESRGDVTEDVTRFVERAETTYEPEPPVTLDDLLPRFAVDLYTQTELKLVEVYPHSLSTIDHHIPVRQKQ